MEWLFCGKNIKKKLNLPLFSPLSILQFLSFKLLFIYAILGYLFIIKTKLFSSNQLSKSILGRILLLKMFIGVLYIFVHQHFIKAGDIFHYFNDSKIVYTHFPYALKNYFYLVFGPNNVSIPSALAPSIAEMGFWGDTGSYMLVRFNALMQLLSMGNIYIHGLFAAFFSFIGSYLLAKTFEEQIQLNRIGYYSIFLFPSLLFWTSGIHKEFISTLALGIIIYSYFKLINQKIQWQYLILFLLSLCLYFFTRNYMIIALLPSLVAWFFHKKFHISFLRSLIVVLALLVFVLGYVPLPIYEQTGFEIIVEKRNQFEALTKGNTAIVLDNIDANWLSLVKNTPQALINTIVRPYFFESKTLFVGLLSLESFFLTFLFVFAIIKFAYTPATERNFIVFMLTNGMLLLLLIGWIVPNLGAIARYRSIALLFIIPSLLHIILKKKAINSSFLKK